METAAADERRLGMKPTKQPPLGLMPKWLHDEMRLRELCEAIARRYDAGFEIPIEWVEEYNLLIRNEQEAQT